MIFSLSLSFSLSLCLSLSLSIKVNNGSPSYKIREPKTERYVWIDELYPCQMKSTTL